MTVKYKHAYVIRSRHTHVVPWIYYGDGGDLHDAEIHPLSFATKIAIKLSRRFLIEEIEIVRVRCVDEERWEPVPYPEVENYRIRNVYQSKASGDPVDEEQIDTFCHPNWACGGLERRVPYELHWEIATEDT